MKEYTYFISYSYQGGFGNASFIRKEEIETFEDLNSIKDDIEKNNNLNGVIILNFQKLRKMKGEGNK